MITTPNGHKILAQYNYQPVDGPVAPVALLIERDGDTRVEVWQSAHEAIARAMCLAQVVPVNGGHARGFALDLFRVQ
jgi:hypothetical protein